METGFYAKLIKISMSLIFFFVTFANVKEPRI